MWEKSGELDWDRVIICDGMVPFELLDALDGQDRRASAQCDDDGGGEHEIVVVGHRDDAGRPYWRPGRCSCRCFAGRASHYLFCALRNIALRVE